MRVYALYSKNNYILLALTALAFLSVVVGFVKGFLCTFIRLFADWPRLIDRDRDWIGRRPVSHNASSAACLPYEPRAFWWRVRTYTIIALSQVKLFYYRGRCELSWTTASMIQAKRFTWAVLSSAWGILLAFDVSVFAFTIYKATKVGYNAPLIQIIVRDGECICFTYINKWLIPFTKGSLYFVCGLRVLYSDSTVFDPAVVFHPVYSSS